MKNYLKDRNITKTSNNIRKLFQKHDFRRNEKNFQNKKGFK